MGKKNPGDKGCVVFGLYDGEEQNKSSACLECKKANKKLFNACIKSGIKFMGNNVATLDEFQVIKPKEINKAYKRMKKHMGPEQEKPQMNKDLEICINPPTTDKKQVVRGGQTVGILVTAKKLLSEGKSYKEVLGTLIGIYMAVLRDPKRAKHNAQSTIFNALKRLDLKKANNELGYEKA